LTHILSRTRPNGKPVIGATRLSRARQAAPLLALLWLVQACSSSPPSGQVVAVVNGEEVTLSELNEEARARGIAIGANPAAQRQLLQELLDRKLLAQAAVHAGVDRTPDYLLARRRAEELLLAQQLVADSSDGPRDISPAQIEALAKANPHAFAERSLLSVDQLTFAPPAAGQLQALSRLKSLDEVEAKLRSLHIDSTRSAETWDSASLDPHLLEQLASATSGRGWLLVPTQQRVSAIHVISKSPRPVPEGEYERYATEWLKARKSQEAATTLLANARKSAEIQYKSGFQPR
jgi:EpsD family peptidyl-prolyl cis-trans isomerase